MLDGRHPPIVRLKKIALVLVLIGTCSIAAVIFYNLSVATNASRIHGQPSEGTVQTVASASDTAWEDEKVINKKNPAEKDSTTKVLSTSEKTRSISSNTPLSPPDPDTLRAMSAPIPSNMIAESSTSNTTLSSTEIGSKEANLSKLKNPSTPYVIQPGTFIPAILITGINSDLPGQIIAQVRENVYDSVRGQYLLIPQGSKLMGVYDAKIIYGQERVLVAWQRLLLPNGQSMDLHDMAGVDNSGYAGFTDHVDAHYRKLLGSAVFMSVLGASAQFCQPQTSAMGSETPHTLTQSLAENAGTSLIHTASELTNKNLNIQPTLEIRPGYTFNVSVTKELVFMKAYDDVAEG
jgi:type IV secretory pathway VirB10-like protein